MKIPNIKPPIPLKANATFYFLKPTGEHAVDPVTGNEEPVKTEVSIKAAIAELGNERNTNDSPGLDQNMRRVRGYLLVESLPRELRSSDRVKVVMTSSGFPEEGIMFFTERLTSMTDNIVNTIGVPIEGYFQVIGGG